MFSIVWKLIILYLCESNIEFYMRVKEETKESNKIVEESNPATLEEVVELEKAYEKNKGMQEDKEI